MCHIHEVITTESLWIWRHGKIRKNPWIDLIEFQDARGLSSIWNKRSSVLIRVYSQKRPHTSFIKRTNDVIKRELMITDAYKWWAKIDWIVIMWNVSLKFHFYFTWSKWNSERKSHLIESISFKPKLTNIELKFLHEFCPTDGISNWMLRNKCEFVHFSHKLCVSRVVLIKDYIIQTGTGRECNEEHA